MHFGLLKCVMNVSLKTYFSIPPPLFNSLSSIINKRCEQHAEITLLRQHDTYANNTDTKQKTSWRPPVLRSNPPLASMHALLTSKQRDQQQPEENKFRNDEGLPRIASTWRLTMSWKCTSREYKTLRWKAKTRGWRMIQLAEQIDNH